MTRRIITAVSTGYNRVKAIIARFVAVPQSHTLVYIRNEKYVGGILRMMDADWMQKIGDYICNMLKENESMLDKHDEEKMKVAIKASQHNVLHCELWRLVPKKKWFRDYYVDEKVCSVEELLTLTNDTVSKWYRDKYIGAK